MTQLIEVLRATATKWRAGTGNADSGYTLST